MRTCSAQKLQLRARHFRSLEPDLCQISAYQTAVCAAQGFGCGTWCSCSLAEPRSELRSWLHTYRPMDNLNRKDPIGNNNILTLSSHAGPESVKEVRVRASPARVRDFTLERNSSEEGGQPHQPRTSIALK